MGNALRALLGKCCNPAPDEDGHASRPHGVTTATVGVSALAADLFHFDNTGEVPDGLSKHVVSSRKAQANWYNKLRVAWKEAKPPPKTPEEASRLIVETLKRHKKEDVQGLLAFYGLPAIDGLPDQVPARRPIPSAERIKFEFITFTVDPKCVADGDTITVYVDTKDPRESRAVPPAIKDAFARRSKARAKRDYEEADILQKQILAAHYRVISGPSGEVLARKYRIRLRGIDAPESSMPYGAEAKAALLKLVEGKSLKVHVYGEDQYGRSVADIYCGDIFVQEFMLKKGLAWHYVAYDKRPEFAQWEKNARAARLGLWAASNPEKPWEWRKDNPRGA